MLSLGKTVFAFVAICGAFVAGPALGQEKAIVIASTTSTQDSGLFDYLLPLFTQKTGIGVKVLAVAPVKRLTRADAVRPTSCSCITNGKNRSSSTKAKARSAFLSCTTTSCCLARRTIL